MLYNHQRPDSGQIVARSRRSHWREVRLQGGQSGGDARLPLMIHYGYRARASVKTLSASKASLEGAQQPLGVRAIAAVWLIGEEL